MDIQQAGQERWGGIADAASFAREKVWSIYVECGQIVKVHNQVNGVGRYGGDRDFRGWRMHV
jgi:hypothetical protein